jgi:ADP-ribose pyrophosphatase YjhB (NUDIX family)
MNYSGAGLVLLSSDLSSTILVRDARTGKWGFPKGHREAYDKNDLDTATRECYEEIGLMPEDYTIRSDAFKINKGSQAYLFRYATLNDDKRKNYITMGPAHEISTAMPLFRELMTSATGSSAGWINPGLMIRWSLGLDYMEKCAAVPRNLSQDFLRLWVDKVRIT